MHLTKLVFAVLPALALADTSAVTSAAPTSTTTCTSTTTLVKTITLSRAHTVTSTWGHNSTTYMPTGGMTSFTPPPATTAPAPTTKGPQNAAGALDATKIAFAGVAGMLVVALM
ncbi:hypothetical protein VFPPC_14459 [Pochonia chlamydosporia 170]|uniref:Uncharacterized protein n=1 Tax=Pochonia chlamydosporia 170 TaxID=1380566 RepID=A0A179FNN2_METCM|nr:hypothetical protein VFPPC_14459 [Pochonia chlamydosporia 170]OAQ67265.1 hypothetical protein VFPPC_14459 [Pochonia chlamydosporia 170]